MGDSTWEALAARRRQSLLDSIPKEWHIPAHLLPPETQDDVMGFPESSGWFTAEELAITKLTALELLPRLADGSLKSETVTRAFCKRAAAAHQLVNCLTGTCFDRALDTARALDRRLAEGLGPVGPFHGLPISLKDNFNLRDLDTTLGFTSHIGDAARDEAELVHILIKAGAVVFVKTNVPTAMMISETVNNLFGRTLNPRNRKLTSGGSSGGESALILFGGSPLGVGTDIGGSLRIPAACTGLFTLRSTSGRFPTFGCRSGLPGQEGVRSVNGPLTRTIADLEYYCKAVADAKPWLADPHCVPIPWRSVSVPRRVKIAVLWHDGMVLPTPPVARALRHTADRLRAAGHEVIDWAPEGHVEGLQLLGHFLLADGGKSVGAELDKTGEPLRPELDAYGKAPELGGYEYWQLNLRRNGFQKRYLDRWMAAGIDAVLSPATPWSGVENGKMKHIGYTAVWNVLDYSSMVFPTGLVADSAVDVLSDDAPPPLSDIEEGVRLEYNAENVHGMPITLQLTANRFEEEKCIEMCKLVLEAL
ncbi:amidase [Xylaria intraflava]|nr:amidase [Xylaria intraflava]